MHEIVSAASASAHAADLRRAEARRARDEREVLGRIPALELGQGVVAAVRRR
jgi:hypothetical protein